MYYIEIGSVPKNETPRANEIQAANLVSVFMRQLSRMRPLLPESGAKYAPAQRKLGSIPWITVQLVVPTGTFDAAILAAELGEAAQEITNWDDEALAELRTLGLAPAPVGFQQVAQAA